MGNDVVKNQTDGYTFIVIHIVLEKASINGSATYSVEKIAALCGMVWFVCIIDACFTWFWPWNIRKVFGAVFVIYATLLLNKNGRLDTSEKKLRLIGFLLIFIFFLVVIKFYYLVAPATFIPLICLVLWDTQTLSRVYTYLKRFVVFYTILSLCVEILVISGLWTFLPNIVLPPQDFVQENVGVINHFYGLFVIPEESESLSFFTFYRIMGPLREGGHFSIFIGFIYFAEKTIYDKRNYWLLIGGLLTLSPNFIAFFLVTEAYCAIIKKRIIKFVFLIPVFALLVVLLVLYSPQFIQDEIIRIVLERNLERNIQSAESEGFMALLEGRTNFIGYEMYRSFEKSEDVFIKLFGMTAVKEGYVMSDFRYLIFLYGYVGFLLYVLCSFKIAFIGVGKLFCFCLFLLAIYVIISRAWMFEQPYIWVMMFLAANAKYMNDMYVGENDINTLNLNGRVVEEKDC